MGLEFGGYWKWGLLSELLPSAETCPNSLFYFLKNHNFLLTFWFYNPNLSNLELYIKFNLSFFPSSGLRIGDLEFGKLSRNFSVTRSSWILEFLMCWSTRKRIEKTSPTLLSLAGIVPVCQQGLWALGKVKTGYSLHIPWQRVFPLHHPLISTDLYPAFTSVVHFCLCIARSRCQLLPTVQLCWASAVSTWHAPNSLIFVIQSMRVQPPYWSHLLISFQFSH